MELGHRQTLAALKREGPAGPSRARVLMRAGHLSSNLNRLAEANEQYLEALTSARKIGDRALVADSLRMLGYLASERGDSVTALAMVEEALGIAHDLQDQMLVADALNAKGDIYRAMDDMEAARPVYEESLALARAADNLDMVTVVCDNLARALIPCGEPETALPLMVEVLQLSRATGSKWRAMCALDVTVGLAAAATDWAFAARMRGAAEARVKNFKCARDRADEAFLAPWTQRIRESLGETVYSAAFDSGFGLSNEQALEEAFTWLAKSADAVTKQFSSAKIRS
jgi:tetratricopeptide (TPR) repeat protein